MKNLEISAHARARMAQRNLSKSDVAFVLQYGYRIRGQEYTRVFLRSADIPEQALKDSSLSRLEGVAVFVSNETMTIVTVTRNRKDGLRQIKRKRRPGRSWVK